MLLTYDEFCKQFGTKYENEKQLESLKKWFEENVSRDLSFTGLPFKQYDKYCAQAKNFLANHQTDQVPKLDKIMFMAEKGYDQFFKTTKIDTAVLNSSNYVGMAPIHIAAVRGYLNTLTSLLEIGADFRQINKSLQTSMHLALMLPAIYNIELKSKKEEIFRVLYKQDTTLINAIDLNGDSIFHFMAVYGFDALLGEFLTKYYEGSLCQNIEGQYPIHTAILNKQLECAHVLLQQDRVSTLTDNYDKVALHYAARYGSKDMVKLCCLGTANVNISDKYGNTPLDEAINIHNTDAIHILIDHGGTTKSVAAHSIT